MLRTLNSSRSAVARAATRQAAVVQRRTFVPSAMRSVDLVQDIYLRELKAYKTPATSPNDAKGHVAAWAPPKAPSSPEETGIAEELKAYETQAVEVEGGAAPGEAAVEEDWFEEEAEEEAPKGGH